MNKLDDRDDEDRVLKDGESISVRVNLMDSLQRQLVGDPLSTAGHRPGSLALSDSDRSRREEMYRHKDQTLSDAWRNAPPLDPGQTVKTITPTPSADRYSVRDARLEQMWRSA